MGIEITSTFWYGCQILSVDLDSLPTQLWHRRICAGCGNRPKTGHFHPRVDLVVYSPIHVLLRNPCTPPVLSSQIFSKMCKEVDRRILGLGDNSWRFWICIGDLDALWTVRLSFARSRSDQRFEGTLSPVLIPGYIEDLHSSNLISIERLVVLRWKRSLLIHPNAAKTNCLAFDRSSSAESSLNNPLLYSSSEISTSARSLLRNTETTVFKHANASSMHDSHGVRSQQQIPIRTGWKSGTHASSILHLRKIVYHLHDIVRSSERRFGPVTASRKAACSNRTFNESGVATRVLWVEKVAPRAW
jgi:hypothetical protein